MHLKEIPPFMKPMPFNSLETMQQYLLTVRYDIKREFIATPIISSVVPANDFHEVVRLDGGIYSSCGYFYMMDFISKHI